MKPRNLDPKPITGKAAYHGPAGRATGAGPANLATIRADWLLSSGFTITCPLRKDLEFLYKWGTDSPTLPIACMLQHRN